MSRELAGIGIFASLGWIATAVKLTTGPLSNRSSTGTWVFGANCQSWLLKPKAHSNDRSIETTISHLRTDS
jgi:hypothetical protein